MQLWFCQKVILSNANVQLCTVIDTIIAQAPIDRRASRSTCPTETCFPSVWSAVLGGDEFNFIFPSFSSANEKPDPTWVCGKHSSVRPVHDSMGFEWYPPYELLLFGFIKYLREFNNELINIVFNGWMDVFFYSTPSKSRRSCCEQLFL